jgi:hypothetical protein
MKMSMNYILQLRKAVCCFLTSLVLISCKSNEVKDIAKQYTAFIETPISIPQQLVFESLGSGIKRADMDSKYKIIVYHSENGCTDCNMRLLLRWQAYIPTLPKDVSVYLIFRDYDYQSIKQRVAMYNDINHPYFVDMDGHFESENPSLPGNPLFHTFLLKDNKVYLIGSPVDNERVRFLYDKALGMLQ